jgi:hypothetical protein
LFDTGTGQRRREWQILYNALANNFLYALRNRGTTSGTDAKSTEIFDESFDVKNAKSE